jgi:hypothetical protein
VSGVIGIALAAALVNYAVFSLTGFPIVWCFLLTLAKPFAFYVEVVNLGLAFSIALGGVFYGWVIALKVAVVLFAFNMVPAVGAAVFGLGGTCV